MPILELLERDRLFELVDGENLVRPVIPLPFMVVRVELVVADAAIFFKWRFIRQKIVGAEIPDVGMATGRRARAAGKDLTDVIHAGAWGGAEEPDPLHAWFETGFAEYVVSLPRDNLFHEVLSHGDDDVGLYSPNM